MRQRFGSNRFAARNAEPFRTTISKIRMKWQGIQIKVTTITRNELGRVKVNQRVKDESDVDKGSEHGIKFFKT